MEWPFLSVMTDANSRVCISHACKVRGLRSVGPSGPKCQQQAAGTEETRWARRRCSPTGGGVHSTVVPPQFSSNGRV